MVLSRATWVYTLSLAVLIDLAFGSGMALVNLVVMGESLKDPEFLVHHSGFAWVTLATQFGSLLKKVNTTTHKPSYSNNIK